MKNIESLTSLYKRDTKGKVRIWTIQYGYDSDDVAGTRTIAGLVDGQKVTSEWNMSVAKNVGKANGTTAKLRQYLRQNPVGIKKQIKNILRI